MTTLHAERLAAVRARMSELGLTALWVRATDRFLNEYVPTAESTRVWLTGFSGSMGEALVLADRALLFVDGRYDIQARRETDPKLWSVELVPQSVSLVKKLVDTLGSATHRLGYESDRVPLTVLERVRGWCGKGTELVPCVPSPVETARGPVAPSQGALRTPDESRLGGTVGSKRERVASFLAANSLDAMVVQRLDELAYLSNVRGDELPYQATFRAVALVTRDKVLVAMEGNTPDAVRAARPEVTFTDAKGFDAAVRNVKRVAMDGEGCTVAMRDRVTALGASVSVLDSPLTALKALKSAGELAAMREAFRKADRVVHAAQGWLIKEVLGGARVSEVDFARQVEKMFREAGASGLSFKVISACGENAALPHHVSSPERYIGRGEMMLLDTGAYFDEGYATDLTRTFFVGAPGDEPTAAMKKYFTLTLKSAIAGMTARLPRGANGAQLDGICRAPLWSAGYEFNHGTGHGVGINVHEAPPRVASVSLMPFEPGQVFSIEPGLYLANEAGVRIENLCTVEPEPHDERFLRVVPMTFSPLDARLLEHTLLNPAEHEFLAWFARQHEA